MFKWDTNITILSLESDTFSVYLRSIFGLPVVWPFFGPAGRTCAAHPSLCGAVSSPVADGAAPRWHRHSRPGPQPESPVTAALPPGTVTAPRCSYKWTDGKGVGWERRRRGQKVIFNVSSISSLLAAAVGATRVPPPAVVRGNGVKVESLTSCQECVQFQLVKSKTTILSYLLHLRLFQFVLCALQSEAHVFLHPLCI